MTDLYFVRHGEYENPDKIVPWRLPGFQLSKAGRENISKVAEYFSDKNIELIYSSPILRAKESAKIISNKIDRKIIISTEISEVYTPLQEKHITYKELFKKRTYPYLDNFHIKNYGESIEDIFKRVNDLVCEVLRKHKEKNIIFFSHGDPIMIYRYKIEGKEIGINDLLDGKEYIPKSGAIKFSFDKSKLLNIKTVNYTESSI